METKNCEMKMIFYGISNRLDQILNKKRLLNPETQQQKISRKKQSTDVKFLKMKVSSTSVNSDTSDPINMEEGKIYLKKYFPN